MFFDFITHYGGAQRSTVVLCERLKGLYDLHIVDAYGCCKPYLSDLSKTGLPVHYLMPRTVDVVIGNNGRPLMRLVRLLRQAPHLIMLTRRLNSMIYRLKPELIWTNNIKSLFFLACCSYFNRATIGLYAHGWYQKKQIPWWQRLLVRLYADRILAVSNPTKKAMTAWGVANRKIHVVYPAIDLKRLQEKAMSPLHRHKIEVNGDFTILVPGSLLATKGQHTVIHAVRLLKKKYGINRKFKIWLAGDKGVGDISGYSQHLKSLVHDHGLDEEVEFLGWRDDIEELMRRADLVVLPTHTEGLPLAIQEAIFLRVPVVTTPVGGIPDLISDGVTGHLVGVEDEEALAFRIRQVISLPNECQRMAHRAVLRYLSKFDAQSQLDAFGMAVGQRTT